MKTFEKLSEMWSEHEISFLEEIKAGSAQCCCNCGSDTGGPCCDSGVY